MTNDKFAFICWACLVVGIILVICGFSFFRDRFKSTNCFFFGVLAMLIPMVVLLIESFTIGFLIYEIILIAILVFGRFRLPEDRGGRTVTMISALFLLLQILLIMCIPWGAY